MIHRNEISFHSEVLDNGLSETMIRLIWMLQGGREFHKDLKSHVKYLKSNMYKHILFRAFILFSFYTFLDTDDKMSKFTLINFTKNIQL